MTRPPRSLTLVLALAFAVAVALPGCALKDAFRSKGNESFTLTNAVGQAISVSVILETQVSGIRLISENVFLEPAQSKRWEPNMTPGDYIVRVTTSTSIAETLPVHIAEKKDTDITVLVMRGRATLTVSET